MEIAEEFEVRRATGDDAATIAEVHVRSWRSAYSGIVPDEFLDELDPSVQTRLWEKWLAAGPHDNVRTWVVHIDDTLIGFASVGPGRDEDASHRDREIYSIYLSPEAWGHGAARELMRTIIAETGEQTPLSLWVLSDNERARHFYRRHGFIPDGLERTHQIGGAELLEVRYRRG
jgi:RimJ/RimL family protein N-acetyltransferase